MAVIAISMISCSTTKKSGAETYRNVPAEQLLKEGEANMGAGNYEEAARQFEAMDALYPFGSLAEQSQLDLIYAYYMADDQASAIAAADRYIRLYPRSAKVAYAYYMRGVIDMERTQTWIQRIARVDPASRELETMQEAFNAFNQLVRFFPDSPYSADARQRMIYIRELIAQHELDIAQYYLMRKTYVAAANRASYVFNHFQGTPQAIEAIGVMVRAYDHLGETGMANDAMQMLKMNFADSDVYKKLVSERTKS